MDNKLQEKPNILLTAILLSVTIVPMGVSGTGVTLPHIASELGAQPTQLQWVVNAFNLTFAVFSLVAGSLADHFGRTRGLIVGSFIFTLSAALSAVAPNLMFLDVARALAGVGAAIVFSCSGALLAITFSGKASARAFSLFGTAAGVGLGFGPTVSSLTIAVTGWSGIFWFSAAAMSLSIALILYSRVKDAPNPTATKIDYVGALIFTSSITLTITGISQGNAWGWSTPRTLTTLLLGIILFIGFLQIERRVQHPLLDFGLLRSPQLLGLLLVPTAGAIGFVTLLTYYPILLTGAWELSPGALGMTMLIMTAPVIFGPLIAGKLHDRGIPSWTILGGSISFFSIGSALLTFQGLTPHPPSLVISFLMIGLGFGLGVGLVDSQAIGSVPEEKSGMASGLVSTVRLGSEAIAVAIFGGILNTIIGLRVQEYLLSSFSQEEKEAILNAVTTGEISGIDTPGVSSHLLKTTLLEGFSSLLWSIFTLTIALSVMVTALLRRSNAESTHSDSGSTTP
ncbi:MFS transporter [Corynebacterium mastitidis]|uniref:MFS transporter n=1 Tax=Corynebacterium mastitidis TaxID=161890 RepID=UPI0003A33695|nr:MFS transporter [Corynebacterium mastitidis]